MDDALNDFHQERDSVIPAHKDNRLLRVGVIMGGRGNEREVSFNSGRTVCDHLDSFRYQIVPIFQRANGTLYLLPYRFLHRGKISDFEHRLDNEAEKITWDSLKERIDFMYIAMHGLYAEDGTIQGFLEVLGIPYLGSKVRASAIGMDKVIQKEVLKAHGIDVPSGLVLKPHEIKELEKFPEKLLEQFNQINLSFPCIIKPSCEGSSLGVSMVQRQEDLLPAIYKAATISGTSYQTVLIEECIKGLEFACITITDYKNNTFIAMPPTEIIPEDAIFDYEQKYMPGRASKFTPARVSPDALKKIQDTCIAATKILEIENISRIDGFLTPEGTVVIIDPNTISGMAPSSFLFRQAAEINMSHTKLINHLIETELCRYGMLTNTEHTKNNESHQMEKQTKKRIGILLGGRSHEKEISLESGRNIFYKLSPHKYEALALFVDDNLELYRLDQALLVRNSTKEVQLGLTPDRKVLWNDLPSLVDFVFIGLHGGEGENGSIQGTLEMLGLPYNGSSILASALCMDKYKTNQFLRTQGFDVPAHCLIEKDAWYHDTLEHIQIIEKKLSYPVIVKPHDDGCSVLVFKAKNKEQLCQAIDAIYVDGKSHALIEECIMGMELTVGVIGNDKARALPPSQAVTSGDILSIEEKFLPGAGENQTPAPLPPATIAFVKKTIERAFETVGCKGYARIDCFYQTAQISPTGSERLVLLEFNTLPGMTPATCIFHQAAEIGIKPMEFIDLIVELGFELHSNTNTKKEIPFKEATLG